MSMLSLNDEPVREQEIPEPRRPVTVSVTLILIGLNVLVFLAMVVSGVSFFSPGSAEVLPWGADFGPLTMSGQWWRLITACFLHFGIIHIAMNMFILLQVGLFTEMLFGKARFLALYLLAGIGGNIAGLYLHPATVSAGASGAIFGLYGGLLAFLLVRRGIVPHAAARKVAGSAGLFIVYNFVYGLASPRTDMEAHIGGLITGFLAGGLLAWSRGYVLGFPARRRVLIVSAVFAAALAASLLLLPKPDVSQADWSRLEIAGTSVPVGRNGRLIYSGAITRSQAERVAQTLLSAGFVDPMTMMLARSAAGTTLSMELKGDEKAPATSDHITSRLVNGKTVIVHETSHAEPLPWTDPKFLNMLRILGPQVASAAGGPPLTIRLLNGQGQLRNEARIDASDVAFGLDHVQFSGQATEQQARELGAALQAQHFFSGGGTVVLLSKSPAGTSVSFTLQQGAWDKPGVIKEVQALGRKIAPSLGGLPLKVEIIDDNFITRKELLIQ